VPTKQRAYAKYFVSSKMAHVAENKGDVRCISFNFNFFIWISDIIGVSEFRTQFALASADPLFGRGLVQPGIVDACGLNPPEPTSL
jgi:hypothetical protein